MKTGMPVSFCVHGRSVAFETHRINGRAGMGAGHTTAVTHAIEQDEARSVSHAVAAVQQSRARLKITK